ncbi:MAG TPA: hypothetical protein VK657_14365, partial [Terriglobales bacterium]|nr:hypothetical protein [Terriglobales bacterium]
MIHMLAVGSIEEAELLLAVSRIVGGIEIEQELAALANLVAAEADELLAQPVVGVHQIAGGRRVLPAAERGLGTERVAQFLIGDDLQHGIVAQTVGVVGVFVAGHDLIDAIHWPCCGSAGGGVTVSGYRKVLLLLAQDEADRRPIRFIVGELGECRSAPRRRPEPCPLYVVAEMIHLGAVSIGEFL